MEPTSWLQSRASLLLPFARDAAEAQGGQGTCPRQHSQGGGGAEHPPHPRAPGHWPQGLLPASSCLRRAPGPWARPPDLVDSQNPHTCSIWGRTKGTGVSRAVCLLLHPPWDLGPPPTAHSGPWEQSARGGLLPGAQTAALPASPQVRTGAVCQPGGPGRAGGGPGAAVRALYAAFWPADHRHRGTRPL